MDDPEELDLADVADQMRKEDRESPALRGALRDETVPPLKKVLRLTIELPDVYADDLDENAALFSEPHLPTAQDRLWLVTEEWFREDVVVTLCSLPGDKCQNHEFEMLPFVGRIVAAETVDNPNFDPSLHARSREGGDA